MDVDEVHSSIACFGHDFSIMQVLPWLRQCVGVMVEMAETTDSSIILLSKIVSCPNHIFRYIDIPCTFYLILLCISNWTIVRVTVQVSLFDSMADHATLGKPWSISHFPFRRYSNILNELYTNLYSDTQLFCGTALLITKASCSALHICPLSSNGSQNALSSPFVRKVANISSICL